MYYTNKMYKFIIWVCVQNLATLVEFSLCMAVFLVLTLDCNK